MNTIEIENTVARDKRLDKQLLGVFSCDSLPTVQDKPACFVANTEPSTEPGQHWVAMFFNEYVEYFDSYGQEPLKEFKVYNPNKTNEYCLQDLNTAVCGEYCICLLHQTSRNISFDNIIDYLRKKVNNNGNIANIFVDKIRVKSNSSDCQSCLKRCRNEASQYCSLR